ncbi:transforming growth factor beta receptor type 3, partial [Gouania willdenowi]|uniref:transforming growth factor beta receptor type 3 n=1 Tax=Gouania willdenowi TaxID=441366 RepID=UPI0010551E4F
MLLDNKMASRWCIPVILLVILSLACGAPPFRSPCELLPVGAGHPVQAVLKSFTALAGCVSRATISQPQEVHIINLRGRAPEGPDGRPPKVDLNLKPILSLLHHHKPLVFVLSSTQPLTWNIRAENLALGVQHTFHVSEGSEVYFIPGNFSQSSLIQKESLPHGNEHLINWAQRKYRGVTSFSELRTTHAIYIKVGEDPESSDSCSIDTKFLSLNYLGSYEEPQPSKGCVLSVPTKDQEVHIIELQAPNSSSALQVDVVVDLQPLRDDQQLLRDVVLLLKCSKSVNWVIKTHSVVGKLVVVASDTVSVSSPMMLNKSPKQPLPSGSQALIKWAEDHNYSPVTSYTSTAVANHFKLRLRPPDVVELPELSILRDSSAPFSGPPLPFPPLLADGLLPDFMERPWGDPEPEEVQGSLSVGLSVRCEERRMVVSLERESLQANGITHANLTLQDPECKALVNATHYTLETPLTGCQTSIYPMQDSPMVLYINSVIISPVETKDGSGGPDDDEDLESEDVLNSRSPDDIFRGPQQASIVAFNCTYRKKQQKSDVVPRIVPGPAKPAVSDMTFSMELYNSPVFSNPSHQAFYTVTHQQQLFVEVTSTASDPWLGFTIVSCFISPNSEPSVPSDYNLIETICPTDDSVMFYPQKDSPTSHPTVEKKSFSFVFNSKFNISLLFLHCEMSLCTQRSEGKQELPPCLKPSASCDSLSVDNIIAMMMNTKISTKPMVVVNTSIQPD